MPAPGASAGHLIVSKAAAKAAPCGKAPMAGIRGKTFQKTKACPAGYGEFQGFTVSPQNSDRIWAIIENKEGGVYRSDDAGETWQKLNDERSLRQRAWYYTRIYADTEDEDKVYVVNVRYHRSKDGGKNLPVVRRPTW